MKRREFVIGAAGLFGALPVREALGQQPCPPVLSIEGGTSSPPFTCGSTTALPIGQLTQEAVTPEQIALHARVNGAISADTVALVRYRLAAGGIWKQAHPLYRADPGGSNDAFAGTIFDLVPGEVYDIEVAFAHSAGQDVRTTADHGVFPTRVLPIAPGIPDATPNSIAALEAAIASATPGDVIELQDGTYPLSSNLLISNGGTAGDPIYIRGQSKAGTVFDASGGGEIHVRADHVVLENFTLNGSGGTGKRGIVLGATGPTVTVTDIVVRDTIIANVGIGIQSAGGSSGTRSDRCLVYNNTITGIHAWSYELVTTNISWNNDGLRLVGTGNCAWNNTISGFGDSITFAHSGPQPGGIIACFAYRNFVRNSGDDGFEADYATRNYALYDNYFENVKNCYSQDSNDGPRYGPSYVFRNHFVNVAIGCVKPNSSNYGTHIYNNTWLRADSPDNSPNSYARTHTIGRGFDDTSPGGTQQRVVFRNNLIIYRGTKSPIQGGSRRHTIYLRWGSIDECEISHNAIYPDRDHEWDDYSAKDNLAQAVASAPASTPVYAAGAGLGAPAHRYVNWRLSESNPFLANIVLGSDSVTEIAGKTPLRIASGASPKNAGVPIPGITDGYSSLAPDVGAVIEGRPVPNWGADS